MLNKFLISKPEVPWFKSLFICLSLLLHTCQKQISFVFLQAEGLAQQLWTYSIMHDGEKALADMEGADREGEMERE